MREKFRCELVSWSAVYRMTRRLAQLINEQGFEPDIIVAIARGGYVPSRILCDFLGIGALTSIRVEHYAAGASKKKCARLSLPLTTDVSGLKVLIVDDVNDTGDTLEVAVKHLHSFQPAQVRVAVLHHKKVSTFSPDFYAAKVVKWRWIIYPWAVHEDVGGLLSKVQHRPKTAADAVLFFATKYRCQVPLQILQDIYLDRG